MLSNRLPQNTLFILATAFLLFRFLLPAYASPPLPQQFKHKTILVLHSYAADYNWTQNLNSGVMTILNQLDWTNTIRVEYMDTKNILNDEYTSTLAALYHRKYKNIQFDGIITTDNNALNFLEKFKDQLFKQVPVVAAGINGVGTIDIPGRATSIIAEQAKHKATLSQALRLCPQAQNCFIIRDSTPTGHAIMAEVKNIVPELKTNVDFHFIEGLEFNDLKQFAATRNLQDFIYLLPYFRDGTGKTFPQQHVTVALAQVATVPLFVSWNFQMETGALAGSVVSGFKQGKTAASTLLQVLAHREVPKIIHNQSGTTTNLYDNQARERFQLAESFFPADTVFLNKPIFFYEQYRAVILPGAAIIITLLLFLLLISLNLKKQRTINHHNAKIIDLGQEMIETQRELVTTLGEVIETRSGETGNHVKRVAKIARFLGQKMQLSPQEIDILEMASPLHDVGKIGIPDNILNKPGKLNSEENLCMQQHTAIGKNILKYSDRILLTSARAIAHQHHERWDGSGYPKGMCGHEINIFARITALADVYDTLSMDHCYKKAWSEEKVLAYIKRGKGCYFDPKLVDIFFENFDEIRALRKKYLSS